MFENQHNDYSCNDSDNIADDAAVKVRSWGSVGSFAKHWHDFTRISFFRKTVDGFDIEGAKDVVSEAHGHENSWDDDIAKAQKRELRRIHTPVSWEKDFDWCIDAFGDGEHDIGSKDKEDVIEEESSKHHESVLEVAQEDELDCVHWHQDGQRVVKNPWLGQNVDSDEHASDYKTKDIEQCHILINLQETNLHVEQLFLFKRIECRNTKAGEQTLDRDGAANTHVAEQQRVNDLFSHVFDEEVEATQGATSIQGELHHVVLGHCLDTFAIHASFLVDMDLFELFD